MKYLALVMLLAANTSMAAQLKCGNGGPGSGTGCSACNKASCGLTRGCGWGTGGCSQNGGAFTANPDILSGAKLSPSLGVGKVAPKVDASKVGH